MMINCKIKVEDFNLWSHHYFGWRGTIKHLRNSIESTIPDPVLFEPAIETTFVNGDLKQPERVELYKNHPWIAFFHHPHDDPKDHFHIYDIVKRDDFRQCLSTLKGIFTVSTKQKIEYSKMVELRNIPISSILHPMDLNDVPRFSLDKFLENKDKQLIIVGDHLRNYVPFYELKSPYRKKALLAGENEYKRILTNRDERLKRHQIEKCGRASNKEYDELLSKNILFMNFGTVTASNAVLECIVRGTPVLVNSHESIIEYLGREYPLYYDSIEEASEKIKDLEIIKQAHLYLKNHPYKYKYEPDYFVKSLFESEVYRRL